MIPDTRKANEAAAKVQTNNQESWSNRDQRDVRSTAALESIALELNIIRQLFERYLDWIHPDEPRS